MLKSTIAKFLVVALFALPAVPVMAKTTKPKVAHPIHRLVKHKTLTTHKKVTTHKKTAKPLVSHVRKTASTGGSSVHPLVKVSHMPPTIDNIHT
jgi:hypothetical protein